MGPGNLVGLGIRPRTRRHLTARSLTDLSGEPNGWKALWPLPRPRFLFGTALPRAPIPLTGAELSEYVLGWKQRAFDHLLAQVFCL